MPDLDMENIRCDKALCRIAEGSADALDVIYETLGKKIYFLALSMLKNESDAEDILQETLLEILKSASRFTPGTNARAWVLGVARNRILKKLRDERPAEDLDGVDPSFAVCRDDAFSEYEVLETLKQTLTDDERKIVLLHFYGGYKYREAAQILGISTETAKKRAPRALKKLARFFGN